MKLRSYRLPRRRFLSIATAAATPLFVPSSVLGQDGRTAPGNRITLGVVGLGSRGFNLIDDFLGEPDAQIVAIADVDDLHYRDNPWGKGKAFGRQAARKLIESRYAKSDGGMFRGLDVYADYREVSGRDDLDAVVVATPDHWHALCTLEALGQGKDVYCEKPLTRRFGEGQAVCREAARCGAVFQVGSQQRSDANFRQAVELVRNGHLGPIERIEVGLPSGYAEPQGDTTVQDPPDHLDYDFWCGPSPKLPYMRARHHRWWRGHRAYGGGVLMDWIGHHNDIAHWALDMDQGGPLTVEAVGWTYPETDIYNTPHHYEIRCEYPGGVRTSISDRHRLGTKWIGKDGWLFVTRGRIEASAARWLEPGFDRGPVKVYHSPGHARNFLDCVKARRSCVAPPETAHRSITPGHLGYVSQALGRALRWHAESERVVGDEEADRLLKQVDYRKPWQLVG